MASDVRLVSGQVIVAGGKFAVTVDGSTPPCGWPAGYAPTEGQAVRVLMVDGLAQVLGPVTTNLSLPTPPPPDPLIPPPPAPAPPAVAGTGVDTFRAVSSGTWTNTWWRTDLRQGAWQGATYTGSWFYGSDPSRLRGKTITSARLWLPARLHIGSYNSPVTLHLYRHTSPTRPGSDVTRVAGPVDITIPVGFAGDWATVPADWGQTVVDNLGGISIATGTYGGVVGLETTPDSGKFELTWRS